MEGDDFAPPEPTFATVSEAMDVIVHDEDVESLRRRQAEQERREFFDAIGESPPRSKSAVHRSVHSVPRDSLARLSSAEIESIVSRLLNGKKVKLTDPQTVAAVIQSLDARRLQALADSHYLDSKRIGDIIDSLKVQLYASDREALFKENIQRLADLHREAVAAQASTVRLWKERRQQMLELHRSECAQLRERHESEHGELEGRWTDPSTQRRFTKRSPQLLQQRAVEKYMVLAGQLEDAEAVKRMNQRNEREETQTKWQDMVDSFESARAKLLADHEAEVDKLKAEQEFRLRNLEKDEALALEVCQKRVAATQHNLDDQSDSERFFAKKFKRAADCVLPVTVLNANEDLPVLARTKAAVISVSGPRPLALPPLKTRKKVTIAAK